VHFVSSRENAFLEYFRCPERFATARVAPGLSSEEGYFTWRGSFCYGRCAGQLPSRYATGTIPDVSSASGGRQGDDALPFDLTTVVTNLREERYQQDSPHYLERITSGNLSRNLYYGLRPALPVWVRRHLQKVRLSGWQRIPFPSWPVDVTVERLMKAAMAVVMKDSGVRDIPFIWFWPDGAPTAAMVTHDVEYRAGWDLSGQVMDVDDEFGITSAFQLIPEMPRAAPDQLFAEIRGRGFEVNLHDLTHDGHLFRDRRHFERCAARINEHARRLGCEGFRSGAMYRKQQWYHLLEFSYDMSVPNVAHLEPQRGGCCTVMPYFVGDLLELPLTTLQDYSLFHILDDYSTALWKEQIKLIMDHHGLVTVLAHPDYLAEPRALVVYRELLAHLDALRAGGQLWIAPPAEINRWWRSRSMMRLLPDGAGWRIEGPDSDRARLAFAKCEGDSVVFELSQGARPGSEVRDGAGAA
jgi:hypothetical protein